MSQTKNGDIELSVEESLLKINDELDKLNKRHGLALQPNDDISKYLNLSESAIKTMDAEDASTAAYMVSRHSAYIKMVYNREMAVIKWARSALNSIAVKKASKYANVTYMKLEEKVILVAAENEYARAVHKKMMASELRVTELYDIASQLNNISNTLIEIQRTKRSERFQK